MSYNNSNKDSTSPVVGIFALIILTILIIVTMFAWPKYKIYSQTMRGKAALAEATQNRQITIEEAQASLEAAKFKAAEDSVRAVGISKANGIIATSLTPAYLKWKWIEGLNDGTSEVIYIATENGMPIMEANRRI